ncbi:MAG: carboxypeptidase-like regulatory domain-containing protein [Planctomycetota bacterium]
MAGPSGRAGEALPIPVGSKSLDAELTTRTQSNGTFHFEGVPAGEYRAVAQAAYDAQLQASEAFAVTLGQHTENVELYCDLPTEADAGFAIQVLAADGKPLPTAYVKVSGPNSSASGTVNEQGQYGKAGSNMERFSKGRLEVTDGSLHHKPLVLDPMPERIAGLQVQMEPAEYVERTLTLVGTDGSSVESARLRIDSAHGAYSRDLHGGKERLTLPGGELAFSLKIDARGFQPWTQKGLLPDALAEDWTIVLDPVPGLTGRVLANGTPIEGATVAIYHHAVQGEAIVSGDRIQLRNTSPFDEARTNADGVFRLFPSADLDYVLIADHKDHGAAHFEVLDYRFAAGRSGLKLELLATGTIEGTALDRDGQPIPRAKVMLHHPFLEARRTRADREGRYRFRRVPAGDWYLQVVDEFEDGFFSMTEELPEGWQYPSNCTVLPEQTTHFDWDGRTVRESRVVLAVSPQTMGPVRWKLEPTTSGRGRDPFQYQKSTEGPLAPGEEVVLILSPDAQWTLTTEVPESRDNWPKISILRNLPERIQLGLMRPRIRVLPQELLSAAPPAATSP